MSGDIQRCDREKDYVMGLDCVLYLQDLRVAYLIAPNEARHFQHIHQTSVVDVPYAVFSQHDHLQALIRWCCHLGGNAS